MIVRDALVEEFPAVGELRVDAYLAQGLIAPGSGYDETLRGLGFGGDAEVLVAAEDGEQAGGPASGRTGQRAG